MNKLQFLLSISEFFENSLLMSSDVANFIACQFALESNFGTSDVAVKQKNLCGMKVPVCRTYFGDGSKLVLIDNPFGWYLDYRHCLLDYISWLFSNRPNFEVFHDLEKFKSFLEKSCYCSTPSYISRITSIYNQYFN